MKRNSILRVLLLLAVVEVAMTDTLLTQQHSDIIASQILKCEHSLVRTQKIARVSNAYCLVAGGNWKPFPDMSLAIDIKMAQSVQIRYNVQLYTTVVASQLALTVFVDNVEQVDYRTLTGNHQHHSNAISDRVWLDKGIHNITLKYVITHPNHVHPQHWWSIASFKIAYYGPPEK